MDTACLGKMRPRAATSVDSCGWPVAQCLMSDIGSCRLLLAFLAPIGVELAHRFAFEFDTVGGMHDAVANGVSDSRISDDLVPLGNGELRTED